MQPPGTGAPRSTSAYESLRSDKACRQLLPAPIRGVSKIECHSVRRCLLHFLKRGLIPNRVVARLFLSRRQLCTQYARQLLVVEGYVNDRSLITPPDKRVLISDARLEPICQQLGPREPSSPKRVTPWVFAPQPVRQIHQSSSPAHHPAAKQNAPEAGISSKARQRGLDFATFAGDGGDSAAANMIDTQNYNLHPANGLGFIWFNLGHKLFDYGLSNKPIQRLNFIGAFNSYWPATTLSHDFGLG